FKIIFRPFFKRLFYPVKTHQAVIFCQARLSRPCNDHLVANILINLSATSYYRLGNVIKNFFQQPEEFIASRFFSNCCRRFKIQKHKDPLLLARMIIFSGKELPQYTRAELVTDLDNELCATSHEGPHTHGYKKRRHLHIKEYVAP